MNFTDLGRIRAATALVAFAVVTFLFVSLESVDPARHSRTLNHLNRLEQSNSDLNEIVLRLRYGLLNNFDPLVATLNKFKAHEHALTHGESAVTGHSEDIDHALAALSTAFAAKETLIERFAYYNAVLKNSVHFVGRPVGTVSRHAAAPQHLREDVETLLQDILKLQLLPTEDGYGRISNAVAQLHARQGDYPAAIAGQLADIVRHAEHILTVQRAADALAAEITANATALWTQRLVEAYDLAFSRDLRYVNSYRLLLLLAALGLLGYAAYAFLRWRQTAG